MQYITILDFLLTPVYLLMIYFISRLIQKRNIESKPEYRYYLPALTIKILGGISLILVYTVYYSGGDTTNYFHDGVVINKLIFSNTQEGIKVLISGVSRDNYLNFDNETGYPIYFKDPNTSFVTQIVAILTFFGARSLVPTTILMSWVSFLGIWNLYLVFLSEFPKLSKEMAISIFYIPSVVFWGSGILKDTISLSALGYFTFSFYMCFIKRKKLFINTLVLIISIKIILLVKAYIFFALLPGAMIWMVNTYVAKIDTKIVRYLLGPLLFFITIGGAYLMLSSMGDSLGKFSVDQILDRAVISQRDLKSSYYQGNAFDIGEFDSTLPSILSVSHKALFAGLYRPFIFEARNLLMLISGIENLAILIFSIQILWRLKIIGITKYFNKNSLLTFSLIFSLFFSLSVGLSTSNFGSLVRYKIPATPFFIASLFIIRYFEREEKAKRSAEQIRLQSLKQLEF